MGNHYLFTCRPVNLYTRVDRSRGIYRRARHYEYSVPVHLSTLRDRLTGPEVNRGVKGILVDRSRAGQVRNTHNAFSH